MGPEQDPWGDRFGYSVSISGDLIASGAYVDSSIVQVARRDQGTWVVEATLSPNSGEESDFGYAVSIDAQTLVVGDPTQGTLDAKGAAYIFEKQADRSWAETQILIPPINDAWSFGYEVDIDGDRLAIGAKGAADLSGGRGWAFVYEREGGTWVHKASLQPTVSAGGDGFGASLDLEGERLLVGAPYTWAPSGFREGLAFVFERDPSGTSWSETFMFSPPDVSDTEQFGRGVALDGDSLAVSAPLQDLATLFAGTIYVFDLVGATWTQTAKLATSDLPPFGYTGWSIDLEGDYLVAGSYGSDDLAKDAGAAYLFEHGPTGWVEVSKFYGSGLIESDTFGYSVDIDGTQVLIGAPSVASSADSPGYAFLFDLEPNGPSLIADAQEVSVSSGGTQTLHLGACAVHAGDLYFVAGSATGDTPGFFTSGQWVPLNPDAYFLHTVNHAGAPPLVNAFGTLDAYGFAQASFELAAGSQPTLAGLALHHAYAVLDQTMLQLEAVSNAAQVVLVP